MTSVNMGVPALSNGEVWGDDEQRKNMSGWNEWKKLVEKSLARREEQRRIV